MPDVGRFFNIDPLAEKYNTWTPYAFSGNRIIDARELEGLEPVEINKGTKNLIIAVRGWQGGNPDPGKTQTQHDDKSSFTGALRDIYKNSKDTQVVVFDPSMNSRTPDDISASIKDFRKVSPNGKLILAGHSMGGDNFVNVSQDNKDIKINKTYTIDISDPLGKADNEISQNVESSDNYYQKNILSLLGGTKIQAEKGNKVTTIKNVLVPNTTHSEIDNTDIVKQQIIKDVQKIIKP